jgi:hypothetical protein
MEKICWIDDMKNEEVLLRVKEERNILRTVKRWLTGLVTPCVKLSSKTCSWRKDRGDGNTRKCKLQLVDLKETMRDLKLREEALDRIVWTTRFGGGSGPVIRQNDDVQSLGVMQEVSQKSPTTFTRFGKGRSCRILNMFRSPLRLNSSRAVITDVARNDNYETRNTLGWGVGAKENWQRFLNHEMTQRTIWLQYVDSRKTWQKMCDEHTACSIVPFYFCTEQIRSDNYLTSYPRDAGRSFFLKCLIIIIIIIIINYCYHYHLHHHHNHPILTNIGKFDSLIKLSSIGKSSVAPDFSYFTKFWFLPLCETPTF